MAGHAVRLRKKINIIFLSTNEKGGAQLADEVTYPY
jgi:hypothetical protein